MYNQFMSCPFLNSVKDYYKDYYRRVNSSYVRILHASPDAPAVDIYVNNSPIALNFPYRGFTQYIPLQNGIYSIKIFPAGSRRNLIIDKNINIPANTILTIAMVNELQNIALYPIEDTSMNIQPGKVKLRFVHLSPNTPSVDVRLSNERSLFKDVEYKEVTNYITMNPNIYTVEIYKTNSNQRILYVPNVKLMSNKFYTIYAVGLFGKRPPLQVLIPLDGGTYLRF
ncbi:protein of unknown function [Caminicella sporogenes DSM 14501]|uniref:DUF4397 domain-containing protein n=1 Tax=Caminicella sporogenes DSM 14501 TaxID=1121266 RepID=A0A1M6SKC8_9FIRM|nr:DUF4397 domain-containing protein [Caminicella sporogenes]RKD26520.1 hypothetical protein BET04_10350 [Caminicella sporogenes]SHK45110.1 protein of unknown function [Caminicella sporogenes DSM 14501]